MATERNWRAVQAALLMVLVMLSIRLLLIYHSRHETPKRPAAGSQLDADAYVVPKKVHAYDLKSARTVVGQPAWVKAGYGVVFYPYDSTRKRADFSHEAGALAPIQKLEIKDVISQAAPSSDQTFQSSQGNSFRVRLHKNEVMAVFASEGEEFAFPIGTEQEGSYSFMLDELVFIQDPRQLYKHWPAEVWQAIDQHQVKPGMNELQVSFAIGVPESVSPGDSGQKVVTYANNGHPVKVTFDDKGRVVATS